MHALFRFSTLVTLLATAAGAQAVSIYFDDISMPAGSFGTPFTASSYSPTGAFLQTATLSFTMTTEGGAWISDLEVAVTDPGGTNTIGTLLNAPNEAGDYVGEISFYSVMPTAGLYRLTFTNAYETAFDVTLSNLKLEVTPQAVPEPTSLAAIALGSSLLLRRRRK